MRDWLAARTRATPTATALVDAVSGNELTYAELNARVEKLASRLSAIDVGVGDHLGVIAPPSVAFVEVVHTAMRLGAVLVPLHERFTSRELADCGHRTDLSIAICNASTEQDTVEAFCDSPSPYSDRDEIGQVTVISIDKTIAGAMPVRSLSPESFDEPIWSPDSTHVLLPTSGTTGKSKIVSLTTGNLFYSATASSWHLGMQPSDRWYCVLPMSHMGGLAPLFRSVLYGTSVVVTGSSKFDAPRVLDELHAHEVTAVSLVPAMLSRLLDAGEFPDSLRFVLLGGAAAPEALVERALDRGIPVCPTYGATETASQVATARPEEAAAAPGSVGHPLMFVDVTLVDENGSPIESGDPGELVISGPTVAPGYYDDPAATDEAFGPHGFHTGDIGYRDAEGRVHILDRLDDRIISGGENVDPGEVAGVLRSHSAVTDAFVTGLPDEEFGQRVAAIVAGDVDEVELEQHARASLAGYKLPREMVIVDELPRTVSGTVDRDAVRSLLDEE